MVAKVSQDIYFNLRARPFKISPEKGRNEYPSLGVKLVCSSRENPNILKISLPQLRSDFGHHLLSGSWRDLSVGSDGSKRSHLPVGAAPQAGQERGPGSAQKNGRKTL